MDLRDVLVVVLGIVAGAGLAVAVVGWQAAARARAKGRTIAGVVGIVARSRGRMLRELADGPMWEGDTISVRGTVPVRGEDG